ncbi:hypothetical protein [Streptomyces sp. NPDC012888]|uniref:hypothetical protein n=1 Tax=Streptomyces sp. NPDC012888 TaxID=3364855 RepID=UPI0036AC9711
MAIGQLTHLASTVTLSTNSSAAATVPNDGSVVAGDFLVVACVMPSGSRTFSISGGGAGGWTSLGTATQAGHMSQVWWRIADGSDPGATITVTPSTGSIRQVLLLGKVSGAAPVSPVTSSSNTSASATTKTTPSLGSVLVNSREVSIVFDTRGASTPQTASWTAPAGETERAEAFTTSGSGACSGAWGDSDATVSGTIGSRVWTADVTALGSAWTLAIAQAEQTISPALLASTTTLYAPTLTATATLAPDAIAASTTLYGPALSPGPVTLSPDPIPAGATLHAPTLTPGQVALAPSLLGSATTLHTPALQPGSVTLAPDPLESTATVYAPTLAPGDVTLTPALIGPGASMYEPTLEPGSVTLTPARIESTAAIYVPDLGGFDPDVTLTLSSLITRWEVSQPW